MPASRPRTQALKPSRPSGQKIEAKIESGTLYGKNPVPASDFLPREPANAIVLQLENGAMNYVSPGRNCQKGPVCCLFSEIVIHDRLRAIRPAFQTRSRTQIAFDALAASLRLWPSAFLQKTGKDGAGAGGKKPLDAVNAVSVRADEHAVLISQIPLMMIREASSGVMIATFLKYSSASWRAAGGYAASGARACLRSAWQCQPDALTLL